MSSQQFDEGNGDSKEYEVEAICDYAVYTREMEG